MESESPPPLDPSQQQESFNQAETEPEEVEQEESGAPPAPESLLTVTNGLIVANVLVFLFEIYKGGFSAFTEPSSQTILDVGANLGPVFATGEYWRAFTCMFVHIGALHILMNMFVLRVVGRDVETLFGPTKFLVIYLLAGIGGSLGSLYWAPLNVSAGASGAVFGAFGSLLAYGWSKRKYYSPERLRENQKLVLTVIGYNLIYGFISPHIDNAAHVAGLVSGLIAALCLTHEQPDDKRWYFRDFLRISLCAVALVFFGSNDCQRVQTEPSVRSVLEEQKAIDLIDAHRFNEALDCLEIAVKGAPKQASIHYHLGLCYSQLNQFDKAIAEASIAMSLDQNQKLPYMLRGDCYMKLGQWEKALPDLTRWVEIDPTDSSAFTDRAQCLNGMGKSEEALEDAKKAVTMNPQDVVAFNVIGVSLMRLNNFPAAIHAFTKAIQIDPTRGYIFYNRAIARLHEKQKKLADEDIAEARSLGFRNK